MTKVNGDITILANYYDLDHLIVYGFLGIVLIVGFIAGRKIKDIRSYAIADKQYGSGILIVTLLATIIGGGFGIGSIKNVFADGLVQIVGALGFVIGPLVTGLLIIPRMRRVDPDKLSMADLMGEYFGESVQTFTGVIGFIYCVVIVAAQLLALDLVFQGLLGMDKLTGILLSGCCMILYTTFGGIKAVAITDLIQFVVLIVVTPIIASLAVNRAGGIGELTFNLPESSLQVFEHEKIGLYLVTFVLMMLPLDPATVQRILMAKDRKQLKKIFIRSSFVVLPVALMILLIGLAGLAVFPENSPSNILPTLIQSVVPVGIKGLAITGLLAMAMSTGDSLLNTGNILLVHDVIHPFAKKHKVDVNELKLTRATTLLSGMLALFLAYRSEGILDLLHHALSIFTPLISIPFIAGFVGLKGDAPTFFTAAVITLIGFIIAKFGLQLNPEFSTIISVIVNGVSFLLIHYLRNGRFSFVERTWREREELKEVATLPPIKKLLRNTIPTPRNIINYSIRKVQRYGSNHILFGAFFCLNNIVPIFMWTYEEPPYYITMYILRFLGGILCGGLLLKEHWPVRLHRYFPTFWHFTLIYCLPFMATVMYLLVGGTTEWLVNVAMIVLLLAWLVDWLTFTWMTLIGTMLGVLFGVWFSRYIGVPFTSLIASDYPSLYLLGYTWFFATLMGLIFFRKKYGDTDETLNSLGRLAQVVAHEVRNVVGLSKSYASILGMCMKGIQEEKQLTEKDEYGNKVEKLLLKIDRESYETIKENVENLKRESALGVNIINRLLINMRRDIRMDDPEVFSVARCVREAIDKYGFTEVQSNHLTVNLANDFYFEGSDHYFKHILFNLFKNAYKYGDEDCQIRIWLEKNKLYFEDSGPGISEKHLPHIFDRFYSTDSTGMGMGLAFCKAVMEEFGGDITCESRTAENGGESYTLFVLRFPDVKYQSNANVSEDENIWGFGEY